MSGIPEACVTGPARICRSPGPTRVAWFITDLYGSFMASGIHGQRLFVSPALDLVVVHYASQVVSPAVPQVPLVQAFLSVGKRLNG
ncbi:hypothetical protein [Streptomyces sp. DSM 118148]|uniref:hypothetical protein n=1 Tax=Streptomyces sp. DSM 118148 TaxID=3448667 RepID=UPI00403FFD7B